MLDWLSHAWKKVKGASWWVITLIIVALVVLVSCLIPIILKKFNVGGLIGRLLGTKSATSSDVIEVANSVPESRLDPAGEPIPQGVPDSKGYTQWKVYPVEVSKNPFRDKSVLTVAATAPASATAADGAVVLPAAPVLKKLVLPVGVIDSDVSKVVEVRPSIYVIEVKDMSGVSAAALLKDLP